MTPVTPLEPGVEMFERSKTESFFFPPRTGSSRPLSEATEIFDTDFEDESSVFEEDSPKYSFESVSIAMRKSSKHAPDSKQEESRQSQTTLSSFDEVITPQSGHKDGFEFQTQTLAQARGTRPVEGPRGPHLFRASQTSLDFDFEFALQMSPLLPKETPLSLKSFHEPETMVQTPATVIAPRQHRFTSIGGAMAEIDSSEVRLWSAQQVSSWMYRLGFEETVIEKFEAHDITGQVLLDMQFEDLKELEITSFGKRHQLWAHIESLRDNDGRVSPVPTPFQDTSRPPTRLTRSESRRERSKSRHRKRDRSRKEGCDGEEQDAVTPATPGGGRRRRGRKHRNPQDDVITPAESVSIVAIEQLLPKPHKCAKGERCAKWRKQQRQLAQLQNEHGFPISPEKGGHIFIAGDPGNANTADKVVENVYRPTSENVPSVVASSAALAPELMPEISLQEELLQHIESRDPQENVKQFLSLQGLEPPDMYHTPIESPPTPPLDLFPPLQPPAFTQAPHAQLKSLPRLAIPRSASANPSYRPPNSADPYLEPESAFSPCRTAVSPLGNLAGLYRFGTPATEMDVPLTAVPLDPLSRDSSQSVPPNMQFREQTLRCTSRADWRRPSFALPSLHEDKVFSPVEDEPETAHPRNSTSSTLQGSLNDAPRPASPEMLKMRSKSANNSPNTSPQAQAKPLMVPGHELKPPADPTLSEPYHYPGTAHAGWMKKRRTKLLRHEWHDAHFRLNGTLLSQHANALPSSNSLATIDVDDYAIACSSIASGKLSAKLRALKITSSQSTTPADAAFSFQLVPSAPEGYGNGESRKKVAGGKTHHFAVKTRDERIDWMRELMLAKALKAKGEGYEVQVNGTAM